MSKLIVRASTEADVARCAEIYAHHVLHGTASFEVDPPDLAEMKRRRAAVLDIGLPHLVADRDGRVMGYAYAGNWRPRPAYKFSVEDSISLNRLPASSARIDQSACNEFGREMYTASISGSVSSAS